MRRLWRAFLSSIDGLAWAARNERAFQQELAVLALAVPASFVVAETAWMRVALIACVLMVILVEAFNSAIEKICDHVTPQIHPTIKIVKDLGSGAVLIAVVIALSFWIAAAIARLA